ncbi:MAG TPA: hypothetical protein VI547_01680 [Anaerolineales bacterium]|nr:hypothetical protein [Anaerolineales bacterium]
MASKLCPHCLRPTPDAKLLVLAGCKLVKFVDDFGAAAEYLSLNPNLVIVGRGYVDYTLLQQLESGATPEAAAEQFVLDQKARYYDHNPLIKIWEGHNEPSFGAPHEANALDRMAWYARFESARLRYLADFGLRGVIGNFSTGYPEINKTDLRMWNAFLPAVQAARNYNGCLGLHEYSAPWIWWMTGAYQRNNCADRRFQPGWREENWGEFGWTTLRYRWVYRYALAPAGLDSVPLIITEFGADAVGNNCPGTPSGAWKDLADFWHAYDGARDPIDYWRKPTSERDAERYFAEQLIWYDREIQKDAYVLATTIFTFGASSPTWERYRVDETRIPGYLAAHIRQTIHEPTLPLPPLRPATPSPSPTPEPSPPDLPPKPPPAARGQPREQYSRVYLLLPPNAIDPAWVEAVAEATWSQRRFTIGASADDAGIGNLHGRMVVVINPEAWGRNPTIDEWFAKHYPGVVYVTLHANTPAELVARLRATSLPSPVIARPTPPQPALGQPREQYARTYLLLNPNHTDPAWIKALARAGWARRVTMGGSADDAGIGDLNTRQVIVLNPREGYADDIFAWFAKYYPGTAVQGVEGRTPDEVAVRVKELLQA